MERIAILSAIEALAKHEQLAITHLPQIYSTPTFGPERGDTALPHHHASMAGRSVGGTG